MPRLASAETHASAAIGPAWSRIRDMQFAPIRPSVDGANRAARRADKAPLDRSERCFFGKVAEIHVAAVVARPRTLALTPAVDGEPSDAKPADVRDGRKEGDWGRGHSDHNSWSGRRENATAPL